MTIETIDGPIWRDRCHHPAGSYVGSFSRETSGNMPTELVDVYVYPAAPDDIPAREGRQECCLRYGNREHEYESLGDIVTALIRGRVAIPWTTRAARAIELLSRKGVFRFIPRPLANTIRTDLMDSERRLVRQALATHRSMILDNVAERDEINRLMRIFGGET